MSTKLPFEIVTTKHSGGLTGQAGLTLVAETWRALGMRAAAQELLSVRERRSGASDADKVEDVLLLLAKGGECVSDVEALREDEGLCRLLGRKPSSQDAVLAFLYKFHDDALIEKAKAELPKDRVAYVPEESKPLQQLGELCARLTRAVAGQGKGRRATLDHDATIEESHKKQAQPHYKGGRGYQPAVIYWAEQDLVVGDEFRDGNVPAGMENLRLIKKGFGALPFEVTELFFRADSACYDAPVLKWLANEEREGRKGHIGFSISADMTKELSAVCAALPEERWLAFEERAHETLDCAEIEFTPGHWPKDATPLRYVGIRIRSKQTELVQVQGSLFAGRDVVRYLAVVTNRTLEPRALLRWHWEKAGTIEHVHDVLKNELGAGVLPCGRFGANAAWFRLNTFAYNLLSAMKSLALPSDLNAARPKRLRFAVIHVAGRIASHAEKLTLRVSESLAKLLLEARRRLALVAASLAPA